MSRFLDPAVLLWDGESRDNRGRKIYTTQERIRYEIGRIGSGVIVEIPPETPTNLATIPRWAGWMFPEMTLQNGVYVRAAILHDYLCGEFGQQHWTRYESDAIFRSALISLGCPRYQAVSVYWGVRIWANATGQTGVNNDNET